MERMHGPHVTTALKLHTGQHPEVQRRFVENAHFGEVCDEVRRTLTWVWESRFAEHLILFECKRGRHRSVAAAEVFGALLGIEEGVSSVQVIHQPELQCCLWTCRRCHGARPTAHVLGRAFEVWEARGRP